ncbi:hypothetical protein [Methylocella sp.]|uniref:hypothetical protein n=1 Tax=Methylocella sp. TaxID=1978226 RepID=UPI0037849EA0
MTAAALDGVRAGKTVEPRTALAGNVAARDYVTDAVVDMIPYAQAKVAFADGGRLVGDVGDKANFVGRARLLGRFS